MTVVNGTSSCNKTLGELKVCEFNEVWKDGFQSCNKTLGELKVLAVVIFGKNNECCNKTLGELKVEIPNRPHDVYRSVAIRL